MGNGEKEVKRKRINDPEPVILNPEDGVAKAIYNTHYKSGCPSWDAASDEVKSWVRKQALNAIEQTLKDFT